MMRLIVCLTVLLVAVQAQRPAAQKCTEDSQCGQGECCAIFNDYLIMSKKQADSMFYDPNAQKTGTCQCYRALGENCDPFTVMNGGCGCAPGLHCHFEPDPTSDYPWAPGKRMMAMLPGTYTCEVVVV